jgi:hypothetical protein
MMMMMTVITVGKNKKNGVPTYIAQPRLVEWQFTAWPFYFGVSGLSVAHALLLMAK